MTLQPVVTRDDHTYKTGKHATRSVYIHVHVLPCTGLSHPCSTSPLRTPPNLHSLAAPAVVAHVCHACPLAVLLPQALCLVVVVDFALVLLNLVEILRHVSAVQRLHDARVLTFAPLLLLTAPLRYCLHRVRERESAESESDVSCQMSVSESGSLCVI